MREILDELRAWNEAGEQIALATVVETWGSSPRPLGSRMAVTRSGKMAGSVSNGCIEGAVFEEAQKVLKSGEPKIAAFGVADDVAFEVGLACGGHIEVFVQPLDAVQKKLIGMLEKDETATLRTNVVTGESQLVEGTPPGTELARRDGDWFIEPFRRPAHLVIVGAIHIAIPLHRLAKVMGYRVTVIDARARFATRDRFPDADELLVSWPDEDRGADRACARADRPGPRQPRCGGDCAWDPGGGDGRAFRRVGDVNEIDEGGGRLTSLPGAPFA